LAPSEELSISTFVAGHKGMVGQAVMRSVAAKGMELLTAEKEQLNFSDASAVRKYFQIYNPSSVILTAAKVGGIYANSSQKIKFLTENLEIQNSVILGALDAGVKKLIFLGSSCIYPKLAPQPVAEESLLTGPLESTNEAYALAKIAGVKLCQFIREEKGLDYFSLMPTNLYGPGDNFDLDNSHVPAALLRKFHEAKINNVSSVKVWGTGRPMREFMHVNDLANAIWFTYQNPPSENLVNVGNGLEISITEFASKVAEVVGYTGDIEFDSSMPDGTPRKLLDSSKIFAMGWRPQIELSDGLVSTYKWFIESLESGVVRGYDK
jgi:GDP-L-fucose synthase